MPPRRHATRYDALAVTAPGLASLAEGELRRLGLDVTAVDAAGVAFSCDLDGLCRANLWLRTVSRVVVRVDEFRAATFHELARRAARIDWRTWLAPGRDVSLRVTCRKSRLYHSGAVAERVAEALAVVAGRVETGGAPAHDAASAPDAALAVGSAGHAPAPQLIVVRLQHDRCTISVDSSGALLHVRGYRQATGKAPLRETLGAALLLASGWVPGTPLVDPFCGAGTLAIEGAMLARGMAPGRARAFALEHWPAFDGQVMARARAAARAAERAAALAPINASDRDAGAIRSAAANAERAGVRDDVSFAVRAVSHLEPPGEWPSPGAIVTNPPYGVRVGDAGDLRNLYARAGAVLRAGFGGWRLAVVEADGRLTAALGVTLREVLRTTNGGIPVRLVAGEIPVGA